MSVFVALQPCFTRVLRRRQAICKERAIDEPNDAKLPSIEALKIEESSGDYLEPVRTHPSSATAKQVLEIDILKHHFLRMMMINIRH